MKKDELRIKNKYRAELWDVMQYYFKDYNDHMMRGAIYFDGKLDVYMLRAALTEVIRKFPIINTRFVRNPIKSYWKALPELDINNIFKFVITEDAGGAIDRFVCGQNDIKSGPQLRVRLFRKDGKDTLCFLFSHMVSDGAGFKKFLKALSLTYNGMLQDVNFQCPLAMGDRDSDQFYEYMSVDDRLKAMGKVSFSAKNKDNIEFNLQPYRKGMNHRILWHDTDKELFPRLRRFAKAHGFTVNDVVLAVYFRALQKVLNIEKGRTISVDCVMDLRRYMPKDCDIGFTNLVSKIISNIGGVDLNEPFIKTCERVHADMEYEKEHQGGLGGLVLLNIMYAVFPFEAGRGFIKAFYKNPLIALSNIGSIPADCANYFGVRALDVRITGTVKYAPFMMLSMSTFNDRMTFSIPVACADKDIEIFTGLLKRLDEEFRNVM